MVWGGVAAGLRTEGGVMVCGGVRLDATVWYCDGTTAREEDCRVSASEAF